jgi:hypothetical protein
MVVRTAVGAFSEDVTPAVRFTAAPDSLPHDPTILKQMLVVLTTQLDKTERLLTQLLAAKSGTRSEQLSADRLRLFAQELVDHYPARC